MATAVIIIILIVIIVLALRGSLKHMKGEGGCCGGGSTPKPKKKQLTGQIRATKIIKIDGMHCENCKNRLENVINAIDGVSASVHLGRKEAVVRMVREIPDEEMTRVIEQAGYHVTDIR